MPLTITILYIGLIERTADLDDASTLPLDNVLGIIIRDGPGHPGLVARMFAHDYYGLYITPTRFRIDQWDEEDRAARVFVKSDPHDTSRRLQRANWWPIDGLIFLGKAVKPDEWTVARRRFNEMSGE